MTAVLIYIAVLLMIGSVIVNRTGERRIKAARERLTAADKDLRALHQQLLDDAGKLDAAQKQLAGVDDQLLQAQTIVNALERQIETLQTAPVERYHVFDRLEPRPGTIWEVPVRRSPDGIAGGAAMTAAWRDGRTYLLVATTAREALERAAQRFPRVSGFEVGPATTCRLFDAGGRGAAVTGADAVRRRA